ncbi:MAG: undecaprenyl-diphosphate phosphatase [Saprospiraceae bacterium]|nr:undecaprenyl-diphosphate phosphatase [Saprospiraceae bacterium]
MQEYIESAILGLIQGLTEFLPVSSSGHLEIAKYIFGENAIGEESLLMTVVLHFATALSTIVVFRKDVLYLLNGLFRKAGVEQRTFTWYVIISMIPAAIVGVFFDDLIESMFSNNLLLVGSMLMVTAILLYIADVYTPKPQGNNWYKALIIGISQAIAIIPGISRSGATISTALLLGLDRLEAARFSFLMVVPLIFGKMAKDVLSGELFSSGIDKVELTIGFIAAFITGYAACTWMIAIVKNSKLRYFSIYCLIVGLIAIGYVFLS